MSQICMRQMGLGRGGSYIFDDSVGSRGLGRIRRRTWWKTWKRVLGG